MKKITLRSLMSLFVAITCFAYAQAQDKTIAYKFFEFENIDDSLLKEKSKDFYNKLKTENNSQGYIINYGTKREIAKREEKIRKALLYREDYDGLRITFVNSKNIGKAKTIFWIVPVGAELPKP